MRPPKIEPRISHDTWADHYYECESGDASFIEKWGSDFGYFYCPDCGKRNVKQGSTLRSNEDCRIHYRICQCKDCGKMFRVYFLQ
jgi:hypothetical protein